MRELHGVLFSGHKDLNLKQRALLFDRFHLWHFADQESKTPKVEAELDFLRDRGVVIDAPPFDMDAFGQSLEQSDFHEGFAVVRSLGDTLSQDAAAELGMMSARDLVTRYLIKTIVPPQDSDLVAICELPLPASHVSPRSRDVISIAFTCLPLPNDSCALEDVLDFKAEQHDKQWAFRRFIHDLATKRQTEAEIRDDIEWTLNEYKREMERFKLKRSVSFMETYIIPTVEALENFKPSSFLKGLVSIKKGKIELLEAEAKAPGRECASVFDARKRFGGG